MTLGINSAVKSLPSQNLFMFSTKLDFKSLGWIYAVHQKKQLVHDKLDSPGSSPGGLHESDHPHRGFDYASTISCLSWRLRSATGEATAMRSRQGPRLGCLIQNLTTTPRLRSHRPGQDPSSSPPPWGPSLCLRPSTLTLQWWWVFNDQIIELM
ncbi:hypothetical protein CapIbe_017975 [Capra ibex]